MTQYLTDVEVRSIAEYVRIGMTEDEIVQMTKDLNSIIESLQPIKEYNLEGVAPTFHPIGTLVNVMCADLEQSSFSQEEALINAPKQQDGYFQIPSILGEEGDR